MNSLCAFYSLVFHGLGEPQTFSIDVNRVRNAPLDLYFVVDQSRSMKDTLSTFQNVTGELCRLQYKGVSDVPYGRTYWYETKFGS